MVRFFISLMLVIVLSGCKSFFQIPVYITNGFSLCYNGEYRNIDSLVNVQGYYILSGKDRTLDNDTLNKKSFTSYSVNMMFFSNGMFVNHFKDLNVEQREDKLDGDIVLFLEETLKDSIVNNSFHNSFDWGLYEVFGDTIKVQYINHSSRIAATWSAWEEWYRVIDRNTLVYIDIKPIDTEEKTNFFFKYLYTGERNDTAKFVPLSEIPSSDCWLMKEKWFWCNEKDWENYMDSIGVK